jgi:hypothetical protein
VKTKIDRNNIKNRMMEIARATMLDIDCFRPTVGTMILIWAISDEINEVINNILKTIKIDFTCDKCGEEKTLEEIFYLGPKDAGSEECSPFMEMICICVECQEKEDEK